MQENATMTDTATITIRPPERDERKPKLPPSAFMRELKMPDGRRLLVDRRSIAFLCEGKPEEFGNQTVTIVGFKTIAKACPVVAGYFDLKAWWRGDGANGKAAP